MQPSLISNVYQNTPGTGNIYHVVNTECPLDGGNARL